MAALFVFAAALQYNDPDPLRWMAVYLAAAAACVAALAGRGGRVLPAAVGLSALAWAAMLAPRTPFGRMFESWEMKDVAVEETREFWGLVIVAVWMAALSVAAARRRRA